MDEQGTIIEVIPQFTAEDFLNGQRPFEYIYSFKNNPLKMQQMLNRIAEQCKNLGVPNFKDLWAGYKKSVSNAASMVLGEETNFTGQELKLKCGQWEANDYGITGVFRSSPVLACGHPIMPVERYRNIDSGAMRIKLAYKRSTYWDYVVVPRVDIVDKRKILSLAEVGIDVNSESAGYLVKYLSEVENLNYNEIPEHNSVSRLGWVGNGKFSPYVDDLMYDGGKEYESAYNAVKPTGDFNIWLETVKEIRKKGDIRPKLTVAASFASVILCKIGALSFFLHLWGGSESGKTVATLLGASVWAYPILGYYAKTMNGTDVGMEYMAGFLNNLPLILDELQMCRDKNAEQLVYKLAEGAGKLRGSKGGGIQRTETWHNCMITSGETPIVAESAGGGAKNRTINIKCNERIFDDPKGLMRIISKNYGHAGKVWVEWLSDEEHIEIVEKTYRNFLSMFEDSEATDKQIASACAILTADKLTDELIFKDGCTIDPAELDELLQTKIEISAENAAYNYLCDQIAVNEQHFDGTKFTDVWGWRKDGETRIIKSVFDEIVEAKGFNSKAVLAYLRESGKIRTQSGRDVIVVNNGGKRVRCVCLLDEAGEENNEECPF